MKILQERIRIVEEEGIGAGIPVSAAIEKGVQEALDQGNLPDALSGMVALDALKDQIYGPTKVVSESTRTETFRVRGELVSATAERRAILENRKQTIYEAKKVTIEN